jgi:hypothetical protein
LAIPWRRFRLTASLTRHTESGVDMLTAEFADTGVDTRSYRAGVSVNVIIAAFGGLAGKG